MGNNFSAFMPHGFCISWDPFLLGLHLISDGFVALAYFSIPAGILYLVAKNKELGFKPIYYLFAGFILACGITHVLGMVTLWVPMYYVQGWSKAVTAVISIATALYLLQKLPSIMALPDLKETLRLNDTLREEVRRKEEAQARLAESEANLQQANQRLNQVLNSIPQRVYWKDQELNFVGANTSYFEDQDLRETEPEQSASESIMPTAHCVDRALEEQTLRTRIAMRDREICLTPESNPPKWIKLNLIPLTSPEGEVTGLLGSYQDISPRKAAETKLQNATDTANAALRSHSAFLANMSHEVRTPISGVIGSLALLAESPLDAHQSELVLGAKVGAESMLELLNGILDLSKMEADSFTLDVQEMQLEHLCFQVAKSFEALADNKGISLVCPTQAIAPDVYLADRGRLRQVLTNLVSNALKFTEKGHVTVSIETRNDSSFESTLRFSVKDTGIGIPSDRLDRIFDRFYQVDSSSTRKQKGTGLGLSIVQEIIGRMDGQVGVESQLGKGSEFWFEITLQKTKNQPEAKFPERPKFQRVCFWMSDNIMQERLCSLLTRWGFPLQNLEQLDINEATHCPDQYLKNTLLIADTRLLSMPLATQKALQRAQRLKQCKTLLVINYLDTQNRAWVQEDWRATTITRPISQMAFYTAIEALWFDRQSINPEQAQTPTGRRKFKGRALIVEDVQLNRRILEKTLSNAGLEVFSAENGFQALDKLRENPVDLVFMDCQMPGMDGFEATRRIRAGSCGSKASQLPIIALTAHALAGDDKACYEAGMSHYMVKPLDFDLLQDMLARYLPTTGVQALSVSQEK